MTHGRGNGRETHVKNPGWGYVGSRSRKERRAESATTDRRLAIRDGERQAEDEDHMLEIQRADWCSEGAGCELCGTEPTEEFRERLRETIEDSAEILRALA